MNVTGPIPPTVPVAGVPFAAASTARGSESAGEGRPLPSEASLWDLLTPEEREFFTQAAALGPLTYRPGGTNQAGPPLPTGQRIDVRG